MIRVRFTLLCSIALLAWLTSPPAGIAGATSDGRPQTLLFDAILTHVRSAGPNAPAAGHRQIATGILRTATGRPAGDFAFTCTWTTVTSGGAAETCTASAWTDGGRLNAAGPSRSDSETHTWRVTGGTGRFGGARGTVMVRDLSQDESLVTVTISTRVVLAPGTGAVTRPASNDAFVTRANRLCTAAADRLAGLPEFPFTDFDPLHPDPALLPAVGAFLTGPGDPRPTISELDAALRGLGDPPAARRAWRSMLRARGRELPIIAEQDRAALDADVHSFVHSVHEAAATFRTVAITSTVFGVTRCAL